MAKQPTKDELMAEFFRMLMADGLGQEGLRQISPTVCGLFVLRYIQKSL